MEIQKKKKKKFFFFLTPRPSHARAMAEAGWSDGPVMLEQWPTGRLEHVLELVKLI